MFTYCELIFRMEHIFSSTNRQAQALYWIPSQPFLVSCATSSILLNKIDHKVNLRLQLGYFRFELYEGFRVLYSFFQGSCKCQYAKNEHGASISSISGYQNTVISGDSAGTLIVWNFRDGELELQHKLQKYHSDPINYISATKKGDEVYILTSAGDGKLKVMIIGDSGVRHIEKSFLPLYPLCCAISPVPNQDQLVLTAAFDDYSLRFFLIRKVLLNLGKQWHHGDPRLADHCTIFHCQWGTGLIQRLCASFDILDTWWSFDLDIFVWVLLLNLFGLWQYTVS